MLQVLSTIAKFLLKKVKPFLLPTAVHGPICGVSVLYYGRGINGVGSCLNNECASPLDRTEATWVHLVWLSCLDFIILWRNKLIPQASLLCCPSGEVTFASCLAIIPAHTELLVLCLAPADTRASYDHWVTLISWWRKQIKEAGDDVERGRLLAKGLHVPRHQESQWLVWMNRTFGAWNVSWGHHIPPPASWWPNLFVQLIWNALAFINGDKVEDDREREILFISNVAWHQRP